ncbi:MAG TPA: Sua5/YciO/YrdC/YwlC family protein [Ramlibacter sp.]|nr:Sua5/YciO/YrdC/YwlC family protein [Ramlibacter sp.]
MSKQTNVIGPRLDVEGDIRRAFAVLQSGGIAICPNNVGYGIWGGSPAALERIYAAKQRGPHKRNALITDEIGQREIHDLDQRRQDMIDCVTVDHDLPMGVIAPYRPDHPLLLRKIDPALLRASTAKGTIGMLLNGGTIHTEIGRLSRQALHPVFGSSANLSGTGTRFRLQDVQPELRAIADIELDYGLRRYHLYRRSSTIINFTDLTVVRMGSCYELICDVLKRHFNLDLPADPGRDVNPSGHLQEFALPSFSA